jgi:succinoglycan biosynthesis transport protein ExoP
LESTQAIESELEVIKSDDIARSVIRSLHLGDEPEFVSPQSPAALSGSEAQREEDALENFTRRLTAKRIGISYVIEITFQSANAERAAQVANAVADTYIAAQADARVQSTRNASVWLDKRTKELRQQTADAQRAVVEFKAKSNIVEAGSGRLINDQRLAELNSRLITAQGQIAEAQARVDRVAAIARADTPDTAVSPTIMELLNSPLATKLRTQYVDLEHREAEWSARYGRNHLAVVSLRNQMRDIRSAILDELRRLGESYRSELEIAKQSEKAIRTELARLVSESQATSQAQVTVRELESTAQTYKSLYDNFLQHYTESVEQQSFPQAEARVIAKATPPSKPNYKKTLLVCAAMPAAGLLLGFGFAAYREFSDRAFRTVTQVEAHLRASCLAAVPLLDVRQARQSLVVREPDRSAGPKLIKPGDPIAWTTVSAPASAFSEAIRGIRVMADLHRAPASARVIGVTSALMHEGKSTISQSLALALAQAGARVALVDCDLRNPSLSRALAPTAERGLTDAISATASVDEVMWRSSFSTFDFLPALGSILPRNYLDLLDQDAAKIVFDRLRSSYDYVIADLPPLLPVVDAVATTHLLDSYLLVVEWGRTSMEAVDQALSRGRRLSANLIGIVLNKVDTRLISRYGADYSTYYGDAYNQRAT